MKGFFVHTMQSYNERLEKIKKILRVKLIESLGNDRDEEAATFFQTSVSTFRRWKNGSQKPDTETLTLIAEKLGISLDWFLLGKGDSGLNVEISAPMVARNNLGTYTGDILRTALHLVQRLFNIDETEILKRSGLDGEALHSLLDSEIKPDFEQMEALYNGLGVNPACFFNADEYWIVLPRNQLLLALAAVGYAWKIPDASLLSDTFSVSEEDAKKFLVEWREFLERGKDRVLPDLWIANLARDYGFNSDWLINGTCAIGRKRVVQSPAPLSSQKIDTSIIRELEKKIMKLEDEKAVQDKRINGLEYTIELQKRLLDPQEKGPQALTTSGDVVPPVPTSPSAQ